MNGPLALVGGDELNPGNEPQDELLVRAAGGGPAFVIATAAARHAPGTAVANAQRWFAHLGLAVKELPVRRRSQATSREIAEVAATGRFFYLVGGDPGIVPDILHESAVWEAIVGAWSRGAALAGSSAGAMALGQWTLTRARRPGDHERRYHAALGLLPNLAVLPHFETFGNRWVASALASRPTEDVVLLGVDERSAVVWANGLWRAMGPGGVTVITLGDERRFESGDFIEGLPALVESR